jgi:hypothetical protein
MSGTPTPHTSSRSWPWRRGPVLIGVALTAAGALLGAGVLAWQTDTAPFDGSPCWDSVTDEDLKGLLGGADARDAEVAENAEIRPSRSGGAPLDGRCRITSRDGDSAGPQADIRVHRLDGSGEGGIPWSEKFLSSRLTPLGNGLLGMASEDRAWVALPERCAEPGLFSGPAVVDVSLDDDEMDDTADAGAAARARGALARTAVHAANGAMSELSCPGSLREPDTGSGSGSGSGSDSGSGSGSGAAAAALPGLRPLRAGQDICHVKGLRLPKPYVRSGNLMRISAGKKPPVRTCEIAISEYATSPQLRLQTVQEPDLTGAFADAVLRSGPSVGHGPERRSGVDGSYSPSVAAVRAECESGAAVFVAQERNHDRDYSVTEKVFPAYVAAEAKRLSCGPIELRLPT